MTSPIPVTIIGGYLGSGKTTMINHMLRHANGRRLAVLVNEFGALPIDADLIEAQDDALISIAGGCICCSFGSDLTAALLELSAGPDPPDHMIIETSGVALPGSIASSIAVLPQFSVDGICVLADCNQVRRLAADEYVGDTIARQFEVASMLLLTKSDLIEPTKFAELQAWLELNWPQPKQITAQYGNVPNNILLGPQTMPAQLAEASHHDRRYDSLKLMFEAPVDAKTLAQDLTQPSLNVLRAKGFVEDHSGRKALLQIVGPQANVSFPEVTGHLGLICIGLAGALNAQKLQSLARSHQTRLTASPNP